VVRLIVWFTLFHVGIDFWIFPNYFIDSVSLYPQLTYFVWQNNPLDSFIPFLEVEKREDMFDFRYAILRLASAVGVFYLGAEFLKEPENLEIFMSGSGEIWNDVFEWGQNKFMGVPDNSTALQIKKSAR